MRVSLLIATRDRQASLARTLESVVAVRVPPGTHLELWVVDNGSRDGTWTWLQTLAIPGLSLRLLQEPRAGKSRALNRALAGATGKVLAFIDDDVVLAPTWLEALVRAFAEPELDAVQGGVHLRLSDPPPWWAIPRVQAILAATCGFTSGRPPGELFGSNMAVRNRGELPRFCEDLGPGTPWRSAEDTEWSLRVLARARLARFDPAVAAEHVLGPRLNLREVFRRQWWCGFHQLCLAPPEKRGALARVALGRVLIHPPRVVGGCLLGQRRRVLDLLLDLARAAGNLTALALGHRHPTWETGRCGRPAGLAESAAGS